MRNKTYDYWDNGIRYSVYPNQNAGARQGQAWGYAPGLGAKVSGANGGGLGGWFKNNFGYSKGSGIKAFGQNLGKAGNVAGGLLYGTQALKGMSDLNKQNKTTDDLINDIIISYGNNPIANSYLTSDQKSLLRKAKRGDLKTDITPGDFIPDDIGDFLDIGKGVLFGIPGGIPGMIIGGVGSAVNSGLTDANNSQVQQNAELEALLASLEDAEMQYQSMKRPNFTGLGIQQRYQDMYM